MAFFVDTYFTKINPFMFKIVGTEDVQAKEKLVDDCIALLEKEIEPLLAEAAPYFANSKELTLVEVNAFPTNYPIVFISRPRPLSIHVLL